ncbi:MAG: dihydroorotate dehydrogenase electron transfer subunit [Eggerthellaceae bacterium]|nr:dihydroorotate dehydrogenase electron transfer subunit [Eggerthellaceae bacterium]
MSHLVNEKARILTNENVGPRLHLMVIESPIIAKSIQPGQFVHVKFPDLEAHILRRPFSVYGHNEKSGTIDILYQEVGSVTRLMPSMQSGEIELIGPIGNTWSTDCTRALLVGGGVGAAPLFMLAETLKHAGTPFDVILGAQTKDALVARDRYKALMEREPCCATDDGSYGSPGFCTSLVEERLSQGCIEDGAPYDFLAVCGPEPLMRIVADMGAKAGVRTQVSMEKRMACGIGACLSCVVDTVDGKKRSCIDGPIFEANKVVW